MLTFTDTSFHCCNCGAILRRQLDCVHDHIRGCNQLEQARQVKRTISSSKLQVRKRI